MIPETLSPYLWFVVLFAVVAVVIFLSWRNARPASSIARVLYDAEHQGRRR